MSTRADGYPRAESFTDGLAFWGKARPEVNSATALRLLPFRRLDVAAMGDKVLGRLPAVGSQIARRVRVAPPQMISLVAFWLALLDLGKFAESLQSQAPEAFVALRRRPPDLLAPAASLPAAPAAAHPARRLHVGPGLLVVNRLNLGIVCSVRPLRDATQRLGVTGSALRVYAQCIGFRVPAKQAALETTLAEARRFLRKNDTTVSERIEEDEGTASDLAGTPWLPALDHALRNFKDESFIGQYLSPKLMRELRLFAITDDARRSELEVSAIHDEALPARARDLSRQYDLGSRELNIQVWNVNLQGDRALTPRHFQHRPPAARERHRSARACRATVGLRRAPRERQRQGRDHQAVERAGGGSVTRR